MKGRDTVRQVVAAFNLCLNFAENERETFILKCILVKHANRGNATIFTHADGQND